MIVWFRNDLRLDDNQALVEACREGSSVLPVYCFDPRDYGKSAAGIDKTGAYRARFLIESVAELRTRLQEKGSELVLRHGKPEEVLPHLARRVHASAVYCHTEVTCEEGSVEEAVRAALEAPGSSGSSSNGDGSGGAGGGAVQLRTFWGSTLHHPEDLPFAMERMPTTYGAFRERMADVKVRAPLEAPTHVKKWPVGSGAIDPGQLPTLQQQGLSRETIMAAQADRHARAASMSGGEREAERRLQALAAECASPSPKSASAVAAAGNARGASDTHLGRAAAAMRGGPGMQGPSFSCNVSPWLAMGCLSPRRLYHELSKRVGTGAPAAQQQQPGSSSSASKSTNRASWLQFELLWRDFFRFMTKRYSNVSGVQLGGSAATPEVTPAAAFA